MQNNSTRNLLCTILISIVSQLAALAQWPVRVDATHPQGNVFGTVGEYRPPYNSNVYINGQLYYAAGEHRYHNGTDLSGTGSNEVFAVNAGTVSRIESSGWNRRIFVTSPNGSVTIYWHTLEADGIERGATVRVGDKLGIHADGGTIHLHLQCDDFNINGAGGGKLIKLNAEGGIQWQKTISGGPDNEEMGLLDIEQTADEGYVMGCIGTYYSRTIKLNVLGNTEFEMEFAGQNVEQTADGGYVIVLESGTGFTVVKWNANGIKEWQKSHIGKSTGRYFRPLVKQTRDGGYIMGVLRCWCRRRLAVVNYKIGRTRE